MLNIDFVNSGTMTAFRKNKKWIVGLVDAQNNRCLTCYSVIAKEETRYYFKFESVPQSSITWNSIIDGKLSYSKQAKYMSNELFSVVMEYYRHLEVLHFPTILNALVTQPPEPCFNEQTFHADLVYSAYHCAIASGAELRIDTREPSSADPSAGFSRTFSIVRKDKKQIPKIYFNKNDQLSISTPLDFLLQVTRYLAEKEISFLSRDALELTKNLIEYRLLD